MEKSGPTLKRLFLELGGKSAQILLDDADLEAALPRMAFSCVHAGQGCAINTRLLVPRARYEWALEVLKGVFEGIPKNIMGPLVSARQRDRVLGHIETGKAEGATLVTGGGRPAHLKTGWFVEPTVFGVPDNRMTIAQEEIFGPVPCVIPHDGALRRIQAERRRSPVRLRGIRAVPGDEDLRTPSLTRFPCAPSARSSAL
jgi:aldehyde dehydrogenase (NAD+)